uniref:5-azacytidine-induced protein 2 n=1 Tax=Chinchilla lanigera TaxID=34839 RepID=A0A8C2VNT4_CHILA
MELPRGKPKAITSSGEAALASRKSKARGDPWPARFGFLFCFVLFCFVCCCCCCCLFETGSRCAVQAGLQLSAILPPQPTECWDYRRTPPRPATDPVGFQAVCKQLGNRNSAALGTALQCWAQAVLDALVEDGICILNHEKAHGRDTVTPFSIYSDESVASHFALVTKRIWFLEEKLVGAGLDEETSSVGREQVNKAYRAYREVCIDRDNLKSKLDKMNEDNSESLKVLNEQLQSKEVELLPLRTEVETQQVMRNLNPPSSDWEVEQLSCDLKTRGLEQELELMKKRIQSEEQDLQRLSVSSDTMQHAYWQLKREMSNLHLVTQVQAELLRKLKTSTTIKKTCTPVGCTEDLGGKTTPSPNGKRLCHTESSPLSGGTKVSSEKALFQSWPDNERLIPNDGMDFQEHNSYGRNSLEDNSWVFPSPPKSSETTFGETKSKTLPLPNLRPLHYLDQHNENCLYKS